MPSLILTAFLVVFVAQVVSWIGESVLSEYVRLSHPLTQNFTFLNLSRRMHCIYERRKGLSCESREN
jgi:hypothetical protein